MERSGSKGEAGHESKRPKWGGCRRPQLQAAGIGLDRVEPRLLELWAELPRPLPLRRPGVPHPHPLAAPRPLPGSLR